MAGISSKAMKGSEYTENKRKYNGIELDNDLDINEYEAFYRELDPQTGRWWQIDPKVDDGYESESPYASMYDDPVKVSDLLGDEGDESCCNVSWDDIKNVAKSVVGTVAGFVVGTVDNVIGSNIRGSVASAGLLNNRPNVAAGWNTGLDGADLTGIAFGGGEAMTGAGLSTTATAVTVGTGGLSSEVSIPVAVGGDLMVLHGIFMTANSVRNLASQNGRVQVNNPAGSRGKPDHQEKVEELGKKAKKEARPGETVLRERKIQGHDSRRIPDQQIVNTKGKTRKVFEAERRLNSKRNIKRQNEYKKLGVDQETHPLH